MKKQRCLIIFFSFAISSYLISMDHHELSLIVAIPFARCSEVSFLKNNHLFISSKKRKHVQLFDLPSQSMINFKMISQDDMIPTFKTDRWGENILLAESSSMDKNYRGAIIYNAQTKQQLIVRISQFAQYLDFSNRDPGVLIILDLDREKGLSLYDCKKGAQELESSIAFFLKNDLKKKKFILCAYDVAGDRAVLSFSDGLRISDGKKFTNSHNTIVDFISWRSGIASISSDGTFALYKNYYKATRIDLTGGNNNFGFQDAIEDFEKETFPYSSIIHPNSKYIITMACKDNYIIQFWDAFTGALVMSHQSPHKLDLQAEWEPTCSMYWNSLSVSLCGEYLAAAMLDQCVIYRLLFIIKYGPHAKYTFPYKFFLLKNWISSGQVLPQDIARLVIGIYMDVSQRE